MTRRRFDRVLPPKRPGPDADLVDWARRAGVMMAGGHPLIGVRWTPGRAPTLIPGATDVDGNGSGRWVIPISYGDDFVVRAPNHFERHRLGMADAEAAVEVRRPDGSREVYRGRLVALQPTGSTIEIRTPDGNSVIHGEDTLLDADTPIPGPDPRTPRWRRVWEDLRADIGAGHLKPGDELLRVDQLGRLYGCSRGTVYRGLRRLVADGLVVGRPGWGHFVTSSPAAPQQPDPDPADQPHPIPQGDRIGFKRRPGAPWHKITGVHTVHDTAAVLVADGDTVTTRAPNHLEARRLNTDPGEPVIEIRYADATVEVCRASRIVLRADGDLYLPEGTVPAGYAFVTPVFQITRPHTGPPYWRHLYTDLKADITTGRLPARAQIGTVVQLADLYILSSPIIQDALDRLAAEQLIQPHGDTWHVAGPD
jgi:DNA-binding GntR family transcriptional regulator